MELYQLIKEKKIDILAVQETHLSNSKRDDLNRFFNRQIHIMSSIDKIRPNAMEVAFILRKNTTKWKDMRFRVLILGRAVCIEIP